MTEVITNLTFAQHASDRVTAFCGSWTFVFMFSALCGGWFILNSILLIVGEFDPYPYIFLNLVLTIVGTFQGPLIMMSQNRQADRDRDSLQWLHTKLDRIEKTLSIEDRLK